VPGFADIIGILIIAWLCWGILCALWRLYWDRAIRYGKTKMRWRRIFTMPIWSPGAVLKIRREMREEEDAAIMAVVKGDTTRAKVAKKAQLEAYTKIMVDLTKIAAIEDPEQRRGEAESVKWRVGQLSPPFPPPLLREIMAEIAKLQIEHERNREQQQRLTAEADVAWQRKLEEREQVRERAAAEAAAIDLARRKDQENGNES